MILRRIGRQDVVGCDQNQALWHQLDLPRLEGEECHPHRQAWRWKHYALGLFLCQGYRTTPPHRGDYMGPCTVEKLGLNLIPSFPPIENATLRIWRGSAKRSGPKSLLRCV